VGIKKKTKMKEFKDWFEENAEKFNSGNYTYESIAYLAWINSRIQLKMQELKVLESDDTGEDQRVN